MRLLSRLLFSAVVLGGSCASVARADQLTLHFYHTPLGINWSSPRSLAWSIVANTYIPVSAKNRHAIGHVTVELECGVSTDHPRRVLTGMTDVRDSDENDLILKKKVGLAVMFHAFQGRLQSEAEVRADLDDRFASGGLRWVRFEISAATCERLLKYNDEYKERGYEKNYGLSLRPLRGEGAGCSAFGASFLEVAGLMSPAFIDAWSRTLEAPKDLMAGEGGSRRKVSILTLLLSLRSGSWGGGERPARQIFFWDPDLMSQWVDRVASGQETESVGWPYRTASIKKARGLIVDATFAPTPQGPIWELE